MKGIMEVGALVLGLLEFAHAQVTLNSTSLPVPTSIPGFPTAPSSLSSVNFTLPTVRPSSSTAPPFTLPTTIPVLPIPPSTLPGGSLSFPTPATTFSNFTAPPSTSAPASLPTMSSVRFPTFPLTSSFPMANSTVPTVSSPGTGLFPTGIPLPSIPTPVPTRSVPTPSIPIPPTPIPTIPAPAVPTPSVPAQTTLLTRVRA